MQDQQTYTANAEQEAPRRLYKSRYNKMIDGVCGGIAEYFEVDPTIVRILWVVISFSGIGFFLYLAGMVIMPVNPAHLMAPQNTQTMKERSRFDHRRFWGIFLILIGSFILIDRLGFFAVGSWWHFSWKFFFPTIIILAGLALVAVELKKKQQQQSSFSPADNEDPGTPAAGYVRKELRRSTTDRKLFGVCGGIAKYLGLDSTLVRIVCFVLILGSFGWGVLLYIAFAILMPEERLTTNVY